VKLPVLAEIFLPLWISMLRSRYKMRYRVKVICFGFAQQAQAIVSSLNDSAICQSEPKNKRSKTKKATNVVAFFVSITLEIASNN